MGVRFFSGPPSPISHLPSPAPTWSGLISAVVLAFGPPGKRVWVPSHTGRSPDRNRGKRSTGGSDLEAFVEGARFIARARKYPSPLTRRGSCKARGRVYGEQDPGGSSSFRAAGKAGRILYSFGP